MEHLPCPSGRTDPTHYRDDGHCRCNEHTPIDTTDRERSLVLRSVNAHLAGVDFFDVEETAVIARWAARAMGATVGPYAETITPCQVRGCLTPATLGNRINWAGHPLDIPTCHDHHLGGVYPLEACRQCGGVLLEYDFDDRCEINDEDAERLDVTAGAYHARCCPKCRENRPTPVFA